MPVAHEPLSSRRRFSSLDMDESGGRDVFCAGHLLQMNLWNQIRHDFDFGKFFLAFQDVATASFELVQEFVEINAEVLGAVVVEIAAGAVIEFLSAAGVAVAEVVQADGDLNQPLIEAP